MSLQETERYGVKEGREKRARLQQRLQLRSADFLAELVE